LIQGRHNYDQWVTKFKVQYSVDHANWDYVQNGRVSFPAICRGKCSCRCYFKHNNQGFSNINVIMSHYQYRPVFG
jgi:hypothetical protein